MTTAARRFTQYLSTDEPRQPYVVLLAAWVLAMICVPIARWTIGDSVIPMLSVVTTVLQSGAVLLILQRQWGSLRTLQVFVIVAALTFTAEAVGSRTGLPFGVYSYTNVLQPQLFGVPMIIPLAWMMMLAPSWAVAALILRQNLSTPQRRAVFVLLSACAITAWDLFLDPQMVEWGFWTWQTPSGYFGIPWVNFAGWVLTAMIVTAVVRPHRLPIVPLVVVYAIVWALQSIGLAVFWGQVGPAIGGFLAMGTMLLLAYRSNRG